MKYRACYNNNTTKYNYDENHLHLGIMYNLFVWGCMLENLKDVHCKMFHYNKTHEQSDPDLDCLLNFAG